MQQSIQTDEPDLSQLSEGCADFVKICLCKDASQRPTAAQLQLHPWLRHFSAPTRPQVTGVRPQQCAPQQPNSHTSPQGIQTVLAPRRPPTPPTPVSGSLPSLPDYMLLPQAAVASGVSEPSAAPYLSISSLQSQFADGGGSPMSTMHTYSSSPDVSGVLSGMHASHALVGLDTNNSESLAMGSYTSSTCMSNMMGQEVDTRMPSGILPQSSENAFMHGMHGHDSKSSLSRETSALDHAYSRVSQTVLPPLYAPQASVLPPVGP